MAIAGRGRILNVNPLGWWRYLAALAYLAFVLAPFFYMGLVALQTDSVAPATV